MPIDYFAIIKRAYRTTIQHPSLWLLGLFLSGGFNANFFYLANLRIGWRDHISLWQLWLQKNAQIHDFLLGTAGAIAVIVTIVVVANWAKILFVLRASDILQLQRMKPQAAGPAEQLSIRQESPRYLAPVITMSIFTMVSMAIVMAVLSSVAGFLFDSRGAVWSMALIVFIVVVFFFSCLNIFATFFIIFYRRNFATALNLALDLIASRWQIIVEMAVVLVVIYGIGFFVGTAIVTFFRSFADVILSVFWHHGVLSEFASSFLVTAISGLLLWAWLAIINTFFNISLLLLFTQLVQPPYRPEFKSLLKPGFSPAASTVSGMSRQVSPVNVK